MAKVLIRHECGHKSRVDVGDGNAASKSAQAFAAGMQLCPDCKSERGACPRCGEPLLDPHDPSFCEACFQDYPM